VKVIHSEAWITGTFHEDSFDEALWMYHSTFHVEDVTTVGSFWGLRAFKSTGECRNLTTVNATYGVYLEKSEDVTLQHLDIDGGHSPTRANSRGLYLTGGNWRLLDSTISNVRTGIDMLSTSGTVERVNITNCAHQGVIVGLCWDYTMEEVTVVNADEGFLLTLFSGGRLVRCNASRNRAVGFNFTSRATTTLIECNASGNLLGVGSTYASPRLRDCVVHVLDKEGRPLNRTLAMDFLESSPDIRGGEIRYGKGGIRLNATRALVRNVTFTGMEGWCIQVRESSGDVIEGCRFQYIPMATGIFVWHASPVIRGNDFFRVSYGITGADYSHLVIEDNTIINVSYDGIWLVENTSAESRGNIIRDVGWYPIHVMSYSTLVSRQDVVMDTVHEGIRVWLASTLDMQSGSIVNCSVGVYASDVVSIRVTYTELRDLNRGILLYRNVGPSAIMGEVYGYVEGCYFTNHTAYCIGVFDAEMTVDDCSFLDNIAAIQASNATLRLVDGTMVGSWLFGLKAEHSIVEWTVRDRCRIISSDISGPVGMTMESGSLHIEDTVIDMETDGFFASKGGTLVIRGTQWLARGTTFRARSTEVILTNSSFSSVGPALGGNPGEIGVSFNACEVDILGCSFRRSRVGLALVHSSGEVVNSRFSECANTGIYSQYSHLTVRNVQLEDTLVGDAIYLEGSTLWAYDTVTTRAVNGLVMLDSDATLRDCGIGSTTGMAVKVEDSTLDLFNTTHPSRSVQVLTGGTVNTWWYLTAKVLWPDPEELDSTFVWVLDNQGREVTNGTPDPSGMVSPMTVLAMVHKEGQAIAQGPHRVFADLREKVVWSRSPSVAMIGTALDAGAGTSSVTVHVDTLPVPQRADGGVFSFTITLSEGKHLVDLVAIDLAGNKAIHTITVWVQSQPIVMSPPEPGDGTMTDQTSVVLRGRLSRTENVTVRINHDLAELDDDNYYSLQVDLQEGANDLSVLAEDIYGHQTWANITISADWTPPDLRLFSQREVNTTEAWVELRGTVDPDARLYIQGSLVLLRDGAFYVKYPVYVGETAISIKAVDDIGNTRELQVLVYREDKSAVPEGPNPWEVYIFLVIIPILVVALYVVMRRLEFGGDEG
jgi:hypothetical protein